MLHNNEVISIEEASYHTRPNCSVRRFTLKNNVTNFELTIKTTGATVISCKINNKDELIRLDNDENQQTNSMNRNQSTLIQLNGGFEWTSHVSGDQISFATNAHHNSTITYQLNNQNELLLSGKLRSVNHLSYLVPFYFNLNTSNSTVDGHFLHIKAINLDKSDQNTSGNNSLSFSLSGEPINNDFHSSFIKSPNRINWSNAQDKNVYDLVYTLNGNYKEALILAILSYGSKRIEFSIQNTPNNYSNQITNSFNQLANSSNQSNTQCKLRVKISRFGISLLPANMYEFKSMYKFYF